MDREKLQRGLGLFLDAMRPYAVSIITRECPDGISWDMDFERRIDNERKRNNWQMQRMQLNNNGSSLLGLIDYNNLVTFIINYKESVTREVGEKKTTIVCALAFKSYKTPAIVGHILTITH